jgi:myosin heavy subunit
MEELERLLVDGIGRLKAAVTEGEAVVAGEAQHAEQLAESLRVNIMALEAKVRETEDTVRRKESARQKAEESLSAKINDLQNEVKKREETLENRANKVNDLNANIDVHLKHITQLELAVQKAKMESTSHAKRAEEVSESSKAKLAALEVQLRDKEEIVNKKDSSIKRLEQNLTAKIKDFESQMGNKEELLAGRDAEISDLKSQLQLLTKGINEMSSFFKHAESLTAVEGKGVSPAVPNEPVNGGEEKPAPFQSKHPKVTPILPETAREIVSTDLFRRITAELTQIMGPMASIIIRDQVKALGESMDKFPKTRLPELLEILSKEISDENLRVDFRARLVQNM